ncbi:MAG: hypothetical protein LUC22_05125, partial [Prevotella sp.]|nr:hypothetical protein [Prevotella sp.]
FQLAATNRTTRPRNTRLTSRSGATETKRQLIVEMVCLFVPAAAATALCASFGDTVADILMLAAGLVFIALHRLWIRQIYNRLLRQRHAVIDGFRHTR